MENKNPSPTLNETLAPVRALVVTSLVLWGLIFVGAVIRVGKLDGVLLAVMGGMLAFYAVMMLIYYALFIRKMRLIVDETGATVRIPLTKPRPIAWTQVRSAAIVKPNNGVSPAIILLSIHEPEQALDHKRLMWRNPKRGEEVRFPLTDSRRAIVEHYLRMELPTFQM